MTKAAVFAHFDKNNTIQGYVIYYLKELKKVSDTIIFVSDCDLPDNEIKKIKPFVKEAIAYRHGEYDFGSYKRGFKYLDENNLLNNVDELIFANDSCLGPLYSLEKVWEIMDKRECDFWGTNYFNYKSHKPHVQSFFLVFKSQVYKSNVFRDFIYSIKKEETKDEIIQKYEVGLSQLLLVNGFKLDSYTDYAIGEKIENVQIFSNVLSPLIKTSSVRGLKNFLVAYLMAKYPKYPKHLIFNYVRNNGVKSSFKQSFHMLRHFLLRIHLRDRQVFFCGQWYSF